jgi:hypothetical protein
MSALVAIFFLCVCCRPTGAAVRAWWCGAEGPVLELDEALSLKLPVSVPDSAIASHTSHVNLRPRRGRPPRVHSTRQRTHRTRTEDLSSTQGLLLLYRQARARWRTSLLATHSQALVLILVHSGSTLRRPSPRRRIHSDATSTLSLSSTSSASTCR